MRITKDKADDIILDLLVHYSNRKNLDYEDALNLAIKEYKDMFGPVEAEKYRNAFEWLKRRNI